MAYRPVLAALIAWSSLAAVALAAVALAAPPMQALIVDGQNNHNWQETTPVLKQQLEETGLFKVDVITSPPKNADMSDFKPDFAPLYYEVDNDALFQKSLCVANRENSPVANWAKDIADVLFLRRTYKDQIAFLYGLDIGMKFDLLASRIEMRQTFEVLDDYFSIPDFFVLERCESILERIITDNSQ